VGTGWEDLELEQRGGGRFATEVSAPWQLVAVPQGGIVTAIAVRAMELELDDPAQSLRTVTAMFAGQVAGGPVEVDVQVLRRGRSMSQLTATVRNPGATAGLTAMAAFGLPRRGFDFTELTMPDVAGPDGVRGFRDPLPDGIEFEFARPPMPFWEQIIESRPVIGRPPWEEWVDGPAETAYWYRLDHAPVRADGMLDPAGPIVMCDTMPGCVGQKVGYAEGPWFAPSVDYTFHLFNHVEPGWLLSHQKARYAGDGYASIESALWHPQGPTLVAHACQVMLFAFGR
jgi:acyl-CoA thioesterase